jgi:hypothetical protein
MIAGDVFLGYFHGNEKKIIIDIEGILVCVLFAGICDDGVVDGLTVEGYIKVFPGTVGFSTFAGGGGIGGVANGGTIIRCISNVNVILMPADDQMAGGITPAVYHMCTISNCINNGSITGMDRIGGIAGENSGTIINCINTGKITATASGENNIFSGVGGIVGTCANSCDSISGCINLGDVEGQGFVGGILGLGRGVAGFVYKPVIITNCVNSGYIKGKNAVGGILGIMWNEYVNISNCLNTGVVEGEEDVGSVVGKE